MSKIKIFKSACGMCHGGCGVLVYVKGKKIIKIEGDPKSPLNKGTLCSKGKASLEHLYNPKRLKYPLQRIEGRGEGKWKRISWDEALDIIAKKLKHIKNDFGPHCVVFGQGTGRHHHSFVIEFAHEFGSPNWVSPGSAECFVPRLVASDLTYGGLTVCDYYGKVNPKCILIWGHNPINSGPDGELAYRFLQALKKGSKLIAVDPRRSETVKKANLWLQLRPGTDDALALAMINIVIYEKLYDKDFVKAWTIGFNKLKEHVRKFTPEWAEKLTLVKAEKIREAARLYATEKPACIEWGVAIEQTPNSLQTTRAIAILRALTGNLDVPGGEIFSDLKLQGFITLTNNTLKTIHGVVQSIIPNFKYKIPPNRILRRIMPFVKRCKNTTTSYLNYLRKDLKIEPLGNYRFLNAAHFPTILKAIQTGHPYPIKALLVFGNNSLVTYANSKEVYDALIKLNFFVVVDLYMTPTAELADIVLPAASWLEINHVWSGPFESIKAVLVQQKVIEMHECMQDEQILIELAKRLELPLGKLKLEDIYNHQLSPFNLDFKRLKEIGHIFFQTVYKKYEKTGFNTPSGKVELYSHRLARVGFDPLPIYREPPESHISTPEIAKKYPLILTTGSRIPEFFHSEGRQIVSLRKKHPDPTVEINPKLAERLKIKEGDWIYIETLRGRIKQKAKLNSGIHPKVVNVEHGWWFPEDKNIMQGVKKSNANILTNNKPPYDPTIGTCQLRSLLCNIYKV